MKILSNPLLAELTTDDIKTVMAAGFAVGRANNANHPVVLALIDTIEQHATTPDMLTKIQAQLQKS